MSQCTPDCPKDAQIPIQVEPGENNQKTTKTIIHIPPGTSKVTLKGKDDILQQLDQISCKADDEDLNLTPKSIDNGECLEFTFTSRQAAIQTISCSGPKSAFNLGPDSLHFCVTQLNTTISPSPPPSSTSPSPTTSLSLSSPTSPTLSTSSPTSSTSPTALAPPSSLPSLLQPRPTTTLPDTPVTTPISVDSTSLYNISTSAVSSISNLSTPPTTSGASATNANKATSKASQKGKIAGGVLGGIALILIISILWRRYRRLRNISTSHNEKAMTYRTSQRSSLWSSVPLTSSMLAEATKFDPTRMVKTGLPFDKNTPLAKNSTGGVHPLLPYP